eukprot:7153987-Ditylum_brightwellii.AAC.1
MSGPDHSSLNAAVRSVFTVERLATAVLLPVVALARFASASAVWWRRSSSWSSVSTRLAVYPAFLAA